MIIKGKKRNRRTSWHSWYAWYPVFLEEGGVAWLSPVERRWNYVWYYRAPKA